MLISKNVNSDVSKDSSLTSPILFQDSTNAVVLTLASVSDILWFDHLNETYSIANAPVTIVFFLQYFSK